MTTSPTSMSASRSAPRSSSSAAEPDSARFFRAGASSAGLLPSQAIVHDRTLGSRSEDGAMRPVDTSLSPYDQMQAWRDKRAAAMDAYNDQNSQLTAALGGSVDAFSAMMGTKTGSGYFVSNDLMSSAIFSAVSNTDAEE